MIDRNAKIYIAGHRGLVGSAILKNLQDKGYSNLILRTHTELDLTNQEAVANFFHQEKPEYVFLAAAKVGGIIANNTYRGQFIYENLMIQNNVIHQSYLNNVKKLVFLGSSCIYPKEAIQPMAENELANNTYRGQFIYENLMIQNNVIHQSYLNNVKKLVFLGSSCIYPKEAIQPMAENELLTGPLEYTNEPYAIAKIAGLKMCESYNIQYGTDFIAVMPTNLYGPNDNFNLETSHVLPAMLRKIHLGRCLETNSWDTIRQDLNMRPIDGITGDSEEEQILDVIQKYGVQRISDGMVQVELWGSGKPMREFLWSDEMADATVFVMESVNFLKLTDVIEGREIRNTHINIGTGKEISIKEVATLIKQIVGFEGKLWFNTNKPDGTMRKLLDVSKLNSLGWMHKVEIQEGLNRMYTWYTGYNKI